VQPEAIELVVTKEIAACSGVEVLAQQTAAAAAVGECQSSHTTFCNMNCKVLSLHTSAYSIGASLFTLCANAKHRSNLNSSNCCQLAASFVEQQHQQIQQW
jgi:hypothetical protein